MIDNEFFKMINRTTEMQKAIAPIIDLNAKFYGPVASAMKMNPVLPSGTEAVISKVFRSSTHIAAADYWRDIVHNKTAKGIAMFNSPLWNLTDSILSNQHTISATIEKNLAIVDAYEKARGISKTITGLGSFFETTFPTSYSNKLATLDSALKGLSAQITFRSFGQFDDELLEQFSVTTDKAAALTEALTEKNYVTKEDLKKLGEFIEQQFEVFSKQITEHIDKTAKSTFAKINFWVGILSTLLTIFALCQTYFGESKSNEKAATKEDVQKLVEYTDKRFLEALAEAAFKAKTRITSHLRYKPNSKSRCMFCIKPDETVHIIESNHKWVRVTVIDPSDNLPITGWVMRKHLIRN